MQFTDLRVSTGTRLQLNIIGSDYKSIALPAQLLGYRTNVTLLASLAKKPPATVHRDAKVSVRVGLQSAIVQFDTTIEHIADYPYFYLHLKYPTEVVIEKQLRQAPRFELEAPVSATVTDNSNAIAGRIVDISLNGARIIFDEEITATEVTISSMLFVVGAQQELSLKASIKRVITDSVDGFVYGASFIAISGPQKLLLQALCYELQSSADA